MSDTDTHPADEAATPDQTSPAAPAGDAVSSRA